MGTVKNCQEECLLSVKRLTGGKREKEFTKN